MLTRNLLSSRIGRLGTFGILYVSEGVPLGFTAIAMAAYMRRAGLDVAQVSAFVAMLYLPWAFKWAWAPLIDLVRLERLGGRKAWIVGSLGLMIVTLVAAGLIDFVEQFELLLVLIFVHNVFAATQDVAIDSLAVSTLKDDERGTGNGFMFGGAYIGQGLGGGGALFVAGFWGFEVALVYACMLLGLIVAFTLFLVRDPSIGPEARDSALDLFKRVLAAIQDFIRELHRGLFKSGRGPIFGVVFALTPLGAMALSNAISTTMQVDYGLDDTQIAQINVYSTVLSGVACVIGGWLGDRLGLRKMIAAFYVLSAIPALYLATAISDAGGLSGISLGTLYGALLAGATCTGLHYGTTAAVYMGLTNPLVAASQFTGFMALANLTISYSNFWQGQVAEAFDFATVLYIDAALVVIPLLVLPFMTPRQTAAAEVPPSSGTPLPEAS